MWRWYVYKMGKLTDLNEIVISDWGITVQWPYLIYLSKKSNNLSQES